MDTLKDVQVIALELHSADLIVGAALRGLINPSSTNPLPTLLLY